MVSLVSLSRRLFSKINCPIRVMDRVLWRQCLGSCSSCLGAEISLVSWLRFQRFSGRLVLDYEQCATGTACLL
jgi:hypothetical protein